MIRIAVFAGAKNKCSPEDTLYVEDDKARIKIVLPEGSMKFRIGDFVAGTILALKYHTFFP